MDLSLNHYQDTASAFHSARRAAHWKVWLLAGTWICSFVALFPANALVIPPDTGSPVNPGAERQLASELKAADEEIRGLLARGDLDKALQAANRMVKRWSSHPLGYYYLGVVHLTRNDTELAGKQFMQALGRKSDFVPAILQLAEIDVRLKNREGAIVRLSTAKRNAPNDVRVSIALARHLANSGKEADALEELISARIAYPWSPRPSLLLANYYLDQKDVEKATKYAREAARIAPTDPQVANLVARVSVSRGDTDSAKRQLQVMTQKKSAEVQGYIELGTLHLGERNTKEARKAFEKALDASEGRDPVALMMLGRMELRARDAGAAMKHGTALISNYPEMPAGHIIVGDAELLGGDFAKAVQHYEAARNLDEFTEVIVRLHYGYRRTGRAEQAFEMLESWAKDHPRDSKAQLALATAYEETRKYPAAMTQYEKVLEITPSAVAYNNLSLLYDSQRSDPRSLELAEQALKLSPNNAAILDTVGWLRVKYGSVNEGIPLLERAVKMRPNDATFREHLAKAREKARSN